MGLREKVALVVFIVVVQQAQWTTSIPRLSHKNPFERFAKSSTKRVLNDPSLYGKYAKNSNNQKGLKDIYPEIFENPKKRLSLKNVSPYSKSDSPLSPPRSNKADKYNSMLLSNLKKEIKMKRKNKSKSDNFVRDQRRVENEGKSSNKIPFFPDVEYTMNIEDTWAPKYWNPLLYDSDHPYYKSDDYVNWPKSTTKRKNTDIFLKPSNAKGNKGMFAMAVKNKDNAKDARVNKSETLKKSKKPQEEKLTSKTATFSPLQNQNEDKEYQIKTGLRGKQNITSKVISQTLTPHHIILEETKSSKNISTPCFDEIRLRNTSTSCEDNVSNMANDTDIFNLIYDHNVLDNLTRKTIGKCKNDIICEIKALSNTNVAQNPIDSPMKIILPLTGIPYPKANHGSIDENNYILKDIVKQLLLLNPKFQEILESMNNSLSKRERMPFKNHSYNNPNNINSLVDTIQNRQDNISVLNTTINNEDLHRAVVSHDNTLYASAYPTFIPDHDYNINSSKLKDMYLYNTSAPTDKLLHMPTLTDDTSELLVFTIPLLEENPTVHNISFLDEITDMPSFSNNVTKDNTYTSEQTEPVYTSLQTTTILSDFIDRSSHITTIHNTVINTDLDTIAISNDLMDKHVQTTKSGPEDHIYTTENNKTTLEHGTDTHLLYTTNSSEDTTSFVSVTDEMGPLPYTTAIPDVVLDEPLDTAADLIYDVDSTTAIPEDFIGTPHQTTTAPKYVLDTIEYITVSDHIVDTNLHFTAIPDVLIDTRLQTTASPIDGIVTPEHTTTIADGDKTSLKDVLVITEPTNTILDDIVDIHPYSTAITDDFIDIPLPTTTSPIYDIDQTSDHTTTTADDIRDTTPFPTSILDDFTNSPLQSTTVPQDDIENRILDISKPFEELKYTTIPGDTYLSTMVIPYDLIDISPHDTDTPILGIDTNELITTLPDDVKGATLYMNSIPFSSVSTNTPSDDIIDTTLHTYTNIPQDGIESKVFHTSSPTVEFKDTNDENTNILPDTSSTHLNNDNPFEELSGAIDEANLLNDIIDTPLLTTAIPDYMTSVTPQYTTSILEVGMDAEELYTTYIPYNLIDTSQQTTTTPEDHTYTTEDESISTEDIQDTSLLTTPTPVVDIDTTTIPGDDLASPILFPATPPPEDILYTLTLTDLTTDTSPYNIREDIIDTSFYTTAIPAYLIDTSSHSPIPDDSYLNTFLHTTTNTHHNIEKPIHTTPTPEDTSIPEDTIDPIMKIKDEPTSIKNIYKSKVLNTNYNIADKNVIKLLPEKIFSYLQKPKMGSKEIRDIAGLILDLIGPVPKQFNPFQPLQIHNFNEEPNALDSPTEFIASDGFIKEIHDGSHVLPTEFTLPNTKLPDYTSIDLNQLSNNDHEDTSTMKHNIRNAYFRSDFSRDLVYDSIPNEQDTSYMSSSFMPPVILDSNKCSEEYFCQAPIASSVHKENGLSDDESLDGARYPLLGENTLSHYEKQNYILHDDNDNVVKHLHHGDNNNDTELNGSSRVMVSELLCPIPTIQVDQCLLHEIPETIR